MEVDKELLQRFEQGLDVRHPERSAMPAQVLGFGEISTVFAVDIEGLRGLAFKRMPLFRCQEEVERYTKAYVEYCRLLSAEIGLRLPAYGHTVVRGQGGDPVVYLVQERLPAHSLGNRLIHQLDTGQTLLLVRRILGQLQKVWRFNAGQERLEVAIDGQISNWAFLGDLQTAQPVYIDTSTPLFRVQGAEQLDAELFLRSAPSFLVWILRLFFLKDVVSRYYDFHRVVVDLVANFYKEQRPDLIPALVREANDFFSREASELQVAPLTEKEVAAYYREDAFIWRLYLAMRKTDRFLRTRLLGGVYPYILPDKIKR